MIDVFFCCSSRSDAIRRKMAECCRERWDGNVTMIFSKRHPTEFLLHQKVIAEKQSKTPIYCHADDDCMPLGRQFLERAEKIMECHPEYGLIGFLDHFMEWKEWRPLIDQSTDPDVWECDSAGGIYLVRKGIVEVPPDHSWWDDVAMCGQIHAKGYKVGRFKNIRMNHFGYGLSTTFPERTGLTQVVDP